MSNHQILNATDHGGLRIHTGAGADFGDNIMATLTVPAEFREVQGHFPIVFRRDDATGLLSALVLFGFQNGENLFLDGDRWDARYRPVTLAIQPFLIGRAASAADGAQVHVDLAHPRISTTGEGVRVFDQHGNPTPYLEAIASKLGDLDHAWRSSPAFFAALERHALLEPFSLEVSLPDGSKQSLVGFQTIDEDRLAALDAESLHSLHADGHLQAIYMAIASLVQFGELVARKTALATGA